MDVSKIGVLGSFKFETEKVKLESLRSQINDIDNELTPIIESIGKHKMIPILIGGGHNNSYPLLKGLSKAYKNSINVINCDPHARTR